MPLSAKIKVPLWPMDLSGTVTTKNADTVLTPFLGRTICKAERNTSLLVWQAPATMPSTSPQRNIMQPNINGSRITSCARVRIIPLSLRNSKSFSA